MSLFVLSIPCFCRLCPGFFHLQTPFSNQLYLLHPSFLALIWAHVCISVSIAQCFVLLRISNNRQYLSICVPISANLSLKERNHSTTHLILENMCDICMKIILSEYEFCASEMLPQMLYSFLDIKTAFILHSVQDRLGNVQPFSSDWLYFQFQCMYNEAAKEIAFVAACQNILEHRTDVKFL